MQRHTLLEPVPIFHDFLWQYTTPPVPPEGYLCHSIWHSSAWPSLGAWFGTSHLKGDMSLFGATINHYNNIVANIGRPI